MGFDYQPSTALFTAEIFVADRSAAMVLRRPTWPRFLMIFSILASSKCSVRMYNTRRRSTFPAHGPRAEKRQGPGVAKLEVLHQLQMEITVTECEHARAMRRSQGS